MQRVGEACLTLTGLPWVQSYRPRFLFSYPAETGLFAKGPAKPGIVRCHVPPNRMFEGIPGRSSTLAEGHGSRAWTAATITL